MRQKQKLSNPTALLVLVSTLLAACQPLATSQAVTSTPSATLPPPTASATPTAAPPTASPTIAPTITPMPTATKAVPTPSAVEVTGVSTAQRLDATRGWAIASGRLFWTEDAGQHWREMTPGLPEAAQIGNAFYLDAQQAWVLACETQSSDSLIQVAYTTDGGTNWQSSDLATVQQLTAHTDTFWCGRSNIGELFFLDAQQGWAMVDDTETMNSRSGELFHTQDGGQTWQYVGPSPSGEFRFTSPTTGWMRATCCTGGIYQLYHTQDGGQSWQAEFAPGADEADDFFLPTFLSSTAGILPVIVRGNGNPSITFFETADGGGTWQAKGQLITLPDALTIGSINDVQVLDAQTWAVALPGYGLYWTTDAGQNWLENAAAPSFLRLTLGSATTAWGLTCDNGSAPDCVYLLGTDDMGASWAKIAIKLEP